MPPKAISYKANSIVYFKGDMGEYVYILKTGQVSLNYTDIQTGQEMHDYVRTGEFFGVKSAFGKYLYDETALVLRDSTVLQFTVEDFERLLANNSRIIMKMLKVFSNQLRRIHKKVRSLMSSGEQMDPEQGLYSVGEYYFNNEKHAQAADAFHRYLIYYPAGRFVNDVRKKIDYSESHKKDALPEGTSSSVSMQTYTLEKAAALGKAGQYQEALRAYVFISRNSPREKEQADFEVGVCLFKMNKHGKCISHFTQLLKHNPVHPGMALALYYIGKSYVKAGARDKAQGFLKKSISLLPQDSPEGQDAARTLEGLGGS